MDPQVSLDCNSCLHLASHTVGDGCSGANTSLQDHAAAQQPVKKQTRQWAAWTHQEEESFFSALRQVGKNFEKITCRVQSKNKDQVRHYYYRLVRRMNKLLGPELCLDAKNSKETNAAMLRWWSLLEKYSCKASKLHLKPRRFKLFVETLETQLLRDRKKSVKKRPQGENNSVTALANVSNQGRTSFNENRGLKAVLIDTQNIQKFGTGKGSSLKRHMNIGINRGSGKTDSSNLKTSRHRRKTVAFKRWEKAAIAGVSLVADAAEHLERTSIDKEAESVQDTMAQNGFDYCDKDVPPLPNSVQSCMKLKLQLFPIDESTRRALETDNHNPHLELTLSARKKISSVLEHLNRKWGCSSVAIGELMLFPYWVQKENLVSYDKWTKDSTFSAVDVYTLIGRPPVFRLRYGWFHHVELEPVASQSPLSCTGEQNRKRKFVNEQIVDSIPKSRILTPSSSATPSEINGCPSTSTINVCQAADHAPARHLFRRASEAGTGMGRDENQDVLRMQRSTLSAGDWADSLTNITVGDLLSEASHNADTGCISLPDPGKSDCLQQNPFSYDSFDAAIAAHIFKHQNAAGSQPPILSHVSSLWDAEETCDAFSFQKNAVSSVKFQNASRNTSPETFGVRAQMDSAASGRAVEELSDAENNSSDDPLDVDMDKGQSDQHTSDNSMTDLNGLTDFYWPDSLGPLDLDIPSCRYRSDDILLSDSLGGLNRLISSSLDAFQNCSFFGSERKDPATVEAGQTASISEPKTGSKV